MVVAQLEELSRNQQVVHVEGEPEAASSRTMSCSMKPAGEDPDEQGARVLGEADDLC
jgi:hypothetical protein